MGFYDDSGQYRLTEQFFRPIPLASFVAIGGAAIGDFTSEDQATFGYDLANSEAVGIRWNNHATPGAIMTTIPMPNDRRPGTKMTLHFICSKVGATVGDATSITVAAFNNLVGALHDADANFGGASSALVGNATSKTVSRLTRDLAAADLAAAPCNVTLTIKPTDALLGTDDFLLHSVELEYERVIQAA